MGIWTFAYTSLKYNGVDRSAAEMYRDGHRDKIPPRLLEVLDASKLQPSQMQDYIDEVDYR